MQKIEENNMKPPHLALVRQYFAASVASIGVIALGTMIGWPSPVLKKNNESDEPITLTISEESWMVSLLYLGYIISPIPSGKLMDVIGRKGCLLLMNILPAISWILIYFAQNAYMLYCARMLAGMWNGIISTVMPMYLAEIAEPRVRGSLSTFIQLMTNIGAVLMYIVGPPVSYEVLAIIGLSFPILFFVTFCFMPESPYWLLMKDKREKAAKSFKWLRGKKNIEEIEEELEYTHNAVKIEMEKRSKGYRDLFKTHANRKALCISVLLALFQRMSGTSVLMAYSSITLPPPGAGKLSVDQCVIVQGITWVLSVLIATYLIDSLGRKPLLTFSAIGSGLAMFTTGLWFFLSEKTGVDVTSVYYIPFICFMVYGVVFNVGLGPVASTMQGEMFPSYIRGLASGITSIALAISSLITNKIFQPIGESIGYFLNFWLFALDCVLATFFIIFCVIETKQKTLFEIQEAL